MTKPKGHTQQSHRVLCGVLGIFLGYTGAHRFVLGDTDGGLIRILLTFTCVGCLVSIIEGVIYLLKTDEEFIEVYQVQQRRWF